MKNNQYCIVEDDSGHKWICPLSLKNKVEKSIQDVEAYWRNVNYKKECPEDLTETFRLPSWEGELLTFSNPCLDGELVKFKE